MQERQETGDESPQKKDGEQHDPAVSKSVYKGGAKLKHFFTHLKNESESPYFSCLVYKCGRKFKAQIQIDRVQHYLGLFDNEIEAAIAYDTHARVRWCCPDNMFCKYLT